MTKYGVGIVGTGWVSDAHARAWTNNEFTSVVGCVSRTREGAEIRVKEWGIPCHIYDSFEEMLADPDVQIVSICSPNDLHTGQAIAAARAGKHICVEKPIALTPDDLYELREVVRTTGVKSVVCFAEFVIPAAHLPGRLHCRRWREYSDRIEKALSVIWISSAGGVGHSSFSSCRRDDRICPSSRRH